MIFAQSFAIALISIIVAGIASFGLLYCVGSSDLIRITNDNGDMVSNYVEDGGLHFWLWVKLVLNAYVPFLCFVDDAYVCGEGTPATPRYIRYCVTRCMLFIISIVALLFFTGCRLGILNVLPEMAAYIAISYGVLLLAQTVVYIIQKKFVRDEQVVYTTIGLATDCIASFFKEVDKENYDEDALLLTAIVSYGLPQYDMLEVASIMDPERETPTPAEGASMLLEIKKRIVETWGQDDNGSGGWTEIFSEKGVNVLDRLCGLATAYLEI